MSQKGMTKKEMRERCRIPLKILEEYERWRSWGDSEEKMEQPCYEEADIEHLSTMVTLYDIGFPHAEIEKYMQLLLREEPTEQERMCILEQRRREMLEEIHWKEKQLDQLDYLRFKLSGFCAKESKDHLFRGK